MIAEGRREDSKTFWWIVGAVLLPFSIPILIIIKWMKLLEQKYRNCLPGQVVMITGASSGLGEAMAHVFYRAGCQVILASRREEELERVKADLLKLEIVDLTYPPIVKKLDLSDLDSIPAIIEEVLETFGRIDILINNGGISVRTDVLSASMDVDIKVMLVNYFGSVALTKAVLPSMIKNESGRIVFISSVQGKFALPYRSAYSASKHAIQAFADSLRAEVNQHGIEVTCISPGYINTSLSLNALTKTGAAYGRMDESTERGYSPEKMAKYILKSIVGNEKDVIIAQYSARLAYWIRFWCPSLYFWIMQRRAWKLSKKES